MRQFGNASVVVLLAGLLLAAPSWSTQVKPVNLEEMTDRAGAIFSGRVLEVTRSLDPGIEREVTVVTFEVLRSVKGDMDSTLTIRTLAAAGDGKSGDRLGAVDMPEFRPDQVVVLFLYEPSDLGLTSPVGLGQGRFDVVTDKNGRGVAVNGFGNRNLMRDVSAAATTRLGSSAELLRQRRDLDADLLLDAAAALLSPPGG